MTVIPILLYHSISDAPEPWIAPYAVSPATFAQHLNLVAESGRTALTVSELGAALSGHASLPQRPVVITFDDGFADFVGAAEILAERGLRSTLYVTTGALQGRPRPAKMALPPAPMLDWAELDHLMELGVEIGAHSHTHRQLDTLRAGEVAEELRQSKDMLEQACGRPIPSFAYPHGFQSRQTRRLVAAAGHASACAVMNAFSSDGDDIFALARLTVAATTTPERMAAWLSGGGARIAPYRETLRTTLWRWGRQLGGPMTDIAVLGKRPMRAGRGR
ncbi:polysaccharide deacetylase family protein [Mycolicibacterium sp. lyk4-40-TYG-92]|uniref:polysaccharide deacetylase family protein n=1 Tax=Mycolicibacterium sp. lyk4-40-TYG-92 TaxID=3040295 RepID=UPI00254B9E6A|nr:polysaccharide deacetylase family protein [Mycolicibacterium sp. lyk4-40-TYG-92]